MLRNLIICSLLFTTIAADGQFSLLNVPKSLAFKGDEPLKSDYIDDVFNAALGYPTTGYARWSPLVIEDPFNLPTESVAFYVEGVNNLKFNDAVTNYDVVGTDSSEAVQRFEKDLKAYQSSSCVLDFTSTDASDICTSLFGSDDSVSTGNNYKNLKPESNASDKQFLQSVACLNRIAENFSEKQCNNMVIKLSVVDVKKTHGESSKASVEAVKLLSKAINKINTAAQKSSGSQALVIAIANEASHSRVRRADAGANAQTTYNLAEYYSEDYPVIFNIILWFMVAFGLSLLAISYAIGSMDPGRDSIIYRMTSTRMKKDN